MLLTSLDVEENIISLCCNCHKQIHLGQGYEDMLKNILRKKVIKKVGIDISLENLILYYKWKVSEIQTRVIPSFYWSG
jgi:5-methylcytosine-specific restriction protein A